MATISELAQMSGNAYDVTPSATQSTGALLTSLPGWQVLTTSSAQSSSNWQDGYFGVAYYNSTTHELVIANRGTDYGDG
ncbi:MAG TPA: hypothetical protein VKY31_00685, partial [Terriglobia bacterium]|nr:hypothetical protein [Terriglobia bacterium]